MRILILNQTFYPDVAATAQHMWDLARHLKRAGHEVVALASRNVYGSDRAAFAAHEVVEGIEIIRVGGTAMGKRSHLHRMADFLSFYAAAAWRVMRMPAPDVIIALTSPPMIALVAAMAKSLRKAPSGKRIRFIYHVMDVYPEAAVASGMFKGGGVVDRVFSGLTRMTLRRADAVIALGRDMRALLIGKYGGAGLAERVHVITPWADGRELFPMAKEANALARELGVEGTFNVMYSGNFGVAHDVETIVGAIELTADDEGLCWLFVGGGKRLKELEERARERGWRHVRFLPYQPRERLNESLNLGDVHIVSQLPAFTGIVVPSKLFGILAVGRPTVMVGPADCEVSLILKEHEAGRVVANGDAEGLARAVRMERGASLDHTPARAQIRNAFVAGYTAEVMCRKVEELCRG